MTEKDKNTQDAENYLAIEKAVPRQLDELNLQHDRDAYQREQTIFRFTIRCVVVLFIIGIIGAVLIAYAVVTKCAHPWLISLAALGLVVPTSLLACLLRYTYQKDSTKFDDIKDVPSLSFANQVLSLARNALSLK